MRRHGFRLIVVSAVCAAIAFGSTFTPSDQNIFEAVSDEARVSVAAAPALPEPAAPSFEIVRLSPPAAGQGAARPAAATRGAGDREERERIFPPPVAALPPIRPAAFLVRDLRGEETLYALNASYRWPAASLTKLLAALVALDDGGAEKIVTIGEEALAAEGESGAFAAGERFTVRDLVSAMLLVSSNDAAEAIAGAYGREAFLRRMEERASAIGMTQTTIADPGGLSVLNQASAEDWGVFVAYLAAERPSFLALTRERIRTIVEQNTGTARTLLNIHPFAGRPQFRGGKTGYTPEAKGNLISVLTLGNRTLIFVVLGSEDRLADTERIYDFIASR